MRSERVEKKWALCTIALEVAVILLSSSCAKRGAAPKVTAPPSTGGAVATPIQGAKLQWEEVSTPFPPANITAQGNVFWVCGPNEMIASSSDGGKSWKVRHSRSDGKLLLNIAFVDEKVGHAAGRDGMLLSTVDGGKTWKTHAASEESSRRQRLMSPNANGLGSGNAGFDVDAFSFANANNGIALLGGDRAVVTFWPGPLGPSWGGTASSYDWRVGLTNDGGDHWEDIPGLNSDDAKPPRFLAVAALDSAHYLVIRRQTGMGDVFVFSADAGRSWKVAAPRNDATNYELPLWLLVHEGEYWAFGTELVNRQQGGGYSVPLAMHSKDGEKWTHGVNGSKDFGGCNHQGCFMWDGAVESLYGAHAQYWNVPQDYSLSNKWAIAGDRVCTLSSVIECGPAVPTEKPLPAVPQAGGYQFNLKRSTANLAFAEDCAPCTVKPIWPDPEMNWSGRVDAEFSVENSGAVYGVSLTGLRDARLTDQIEEQIRKWTFKPSHDDASQRRKVSIEVKCIDARDAPAVGGCRLAPARGPA